MQREPFDPSGSLRIVGRAFSVEMRAAHDLTLGQEGRKGACYDEAGLIVVSDALTPDGAAETVLHEVIHATEEAFGAGLSEKQVARLARGLYAVCRDNPDYMGRLLFGAPAAP